MIHRISKFTMKFNWLESLESQYKYPYTILFSSSAWNLNTQWGIFFVRGTGSLQTSMLFEVVYKSFCWFISLISVIQTGIDQRSSTLTSRRYPWGIQRLVSTHWGRMGILGYSKLKVPSADQIFIGGRGGRVILGYSKLKVPSRGQIFIFGIGGSTVDQVIPEIPTSLRIFISGEGVYPWRRGVFWTPHS